MTARKAFTLIELMITVVIIGILAGLALAKFDVTKKRAQYYSALSKVRAIASAEKAYYLSMGSYVSTLGTGATNTVLGLAITDDYFSGFSVYTMPGPPPTFNMTAFSGTVAKNATYRFNSNGDQVACNGPDCIVL